MKVVAKVKHLEEVLKIKSVLKEHHIEYRMKDDKSTWETMFEVKDCYEHFSKSLIAKALGIVFKPKFAGKVRTY